jgi:hypothetical protein
MSGKSLAVDPESYWSPYFTYFPVATKHLIQQDRFPENRQACVIGGSDGKFVLPLIRDGWHVTTFEIDKLFLNGGTLTLRDGDRKIHGLRQRLESERLEDRCVILECDFMESPRSDSFDFVMGSGLWSMDENRAHSLSELVDAAAELVAPEGLLFVEYLIATTEADRESGYYPEPAEMAKIIDRAGWSIVENVDLGRKGESHVGLEDFHYHRYGAVVTRRSAAS